MRNLVFIGGAAGVASLVALAAAPSGFAADHLDATTIAMSQNAMADINDVYAWMTADASKVNLAMTVSPADDGNRTFGDSVQYVFHVTSAPGFLMAGTETRVLCTFENNANGQCWVVNPDGVVIDYVSGDLSSPAGKLSETGKLRVFAGRRSDPFFFNLSGFRTAVNAVRNAGLSVFDAAGCPTFANGSTPAALRGTLQAMPSGSTDNGPCGTSDRDCFKTFNVMAIVVQIDKSELVSGSNTLLNVWGSTHAAP